MAIGETARLIASLELKDAFSKQIGAAEKSLGSFDRKLDQTQSRSFRAGQQIGTGIRRTAVLAAGAIGFLATNVALGVASLDKLESSVAQTNSVLKSTKGVAGQTAASVRALATKYEDLNATIDDTVIQSGENLLLTFTNIRTKAFEPALKAALDMNQALGGGEAGLQGTIQRLGKALNDPIKGLSQLGRVGVTFTKQQQDQIKAAVKAGDTFKAQGIILAELNKRFGGSFLAGGQTTAGKVAKFKDAIDDLQRALATALLPVIGKVADALQRFLADPKVVAGITKLGQSIADLFSDKNLATGADFLKTAFTTAQTAAPIVEAAAKATLGFVQAAVGLFKQLPAPLQGILVGGFALNKVTGGLVTNIAGGLADLIGKSRGGSPANPVFVSDISGGLGGAAGKGASIGSKLVSAATKVFLIGAAVGTFAELKGILENQTKANKTQEAGLSEQTALFVKSASLSDMKSSLAALQDTSKLSLGEQAALLLNIDGVNDSILAQQKILKDAIAARESAAVKPINLASGSNANVREDRNSLHADLGALGGKITDDLNGVKDILRGVKAEFSAATKQLAHPKSQNELVHAAQELEKLLLSGRGGAVETANRIDLLRKQLEKVHDPKTKAALEAKLVKIEGLLPGRQFAARELAKADSILKSHESSNKKIVDLKAVEQALLTRGLPHAASVIRQKEEEVRKAAIAAGNHSADAIKRKRLSVTVNNPLTVSTYITGRSVASTIRKSSKFGVQVE